MALATIEIELEEEVAQIYQMASPQHKEKIQLLLNLWLREFELGTHSLSQIMDEISENAAARGMTPELLDSLLADE